VAKQVERHCGKAGGGQQLTVPAEQVRAVDGRADLRGDCQAEEPTQTRRRLLRRAGIVLQGRLEREPALAPANPRVFLRGGEARFDIDSVALRSDALPALARAVAELLKALKSMWQSRLSRPPPACGLIRSAV